MKRRLALSCCRGIRQESLVNELLAGTVQCGYKVVGRDFYWQIGAAPISSNSYQNLRRRLIHNGFVLVRDRNLNTITMSFPEEG